MLNLHPGSSTQAGRALGIDTEEVREKVRTTLCLTYSDALEYEIQKKRNSMTSDRTIEFWMKIDNLPERPMQAMFGTDVDPDEDNPPFYTCTVCGHIGPMVLVLNPTLGLEWAWCPGGHTGPCGNTCLLPGTSYIGHNWHFKENCPNCKEQGNVELDPEGTES